MVNENMEKLMARDIEVWPRKVTKIKKSYYLCIPMPIARAFGLPRKKGCYVKFSQKYNEKTGKIFFALDIEE